MHEGGHALYLGKTAADWVSGLRSDDPLERRLAAYALGEIGAAARPAMDDLTAALDDPDSAVRVWAAAALAQIEPHASTRALTALLAAMEDERHFVRSLAVWHVARLGANLPDVESALPALEKLRADEDRNVRTEAELAWKKLQNHLAFRPRLHDSE
jgi:HEAT repeat protein